MINLDGAPKDGRVLAYASDWLLYDEYHLNNGEIELRSGEMLKLDSVYEIHLFDAHAEFRAKLEGGKWVTCVERATDEVDDDDHFVFTESQFVRERYWIDGADERIVVNNHFSFNDDGFLRLDGYRLATETA